MSKSVPINVMDALLDAIAASTLQSVVSGASTPTDLTTSLAGVAIGSGDFTKAQGDAGEGSRKITMSAKSGVVVSAEGAPTHVILSLSGVLKLITSATGPTLTVGSNVDFPSWKYELGIPS